MRRANVRAVRCLVIPTLNAPRLAALLEAYLATVGPPGPRVFEVLGFFKGFLKGFFDGFFKGFFKGFLRVFRVQGVDTS